MTPRVRLYACIAAANHRTTLKRVLSECRTKRDVHARREVMHRLYDDGFSFSQIGRWLNRDHSTVMFGLGLINHSRERSGPRSQNAKALSATERGPSTSQG